MDRRIEKRHWRAKKIAFLSAIGLFALAALWNLLFAGRLSRLDVPAGRVTISRVEKGPFQEFIRVTGTVIPLRTVYLDAIEGGRVEAVVLEAGSFVNEGDRILKLANTNLLLDIMNREAELFEQSNNLRNTRLALAQNDLNLKSQLLELDYRIKTQKRIHEANGELKGLVARLECRRAEDEYEYLVRKRELTLERYEQDSLYRKTQIAQLEESLQRMKANLGVVRRNLESLVVKAPVSGQLTSLHAHVGESKARGQRLGQIDILDGFKVRLAIDEHFLGRVRVGQRGEFALSEDTHSVVVRKIYPEVIEGRFEVDAHFDGPEPRGIRRGQTLHVRLALGGRSEALLVARGPFLRRTGGRWAYVIDEQKGVARRRSIRIGSQNPLYYQVLEGLEPGDRVITSSYDHFADVDELILEDLEEYSLRTEPDRD